MKRLLYAILTSFISQAWADCLDINGRLIPQAHDYFPGPDACTVCICEHGAAKLCKAVLCAPPPDCQSFSRVGNSCCNFTCLDDALQKREELGTDLGLRLLVSAVAAILSLSLLFFLVHRLRQRKTLGRRTRALRAERRGLGLGYITGSLGYLPENYFAGPDGFDRHIEFRYEEPPSQLSLWKPPGHGSTYFPRGEAPPPYDEAIAQPRAELTITASSTLPNISHRTIPLNLTGPGTFRIIHPHQHRGQDAALATLPRVPGKTRDPRDPRDPPPQTLQINISSCGFHGQLRQTDDAAVQSTGDVLKLTPPAGSLGEAILADASYGDIPGFTTAQARPRPPSPQIFCGDRKAGPSQSEYESQTLADSHHDPYQDQDDNDDYRSECENCKSSPGGGPNYYHQDEDPEPPETMTLQRLPRETDEEPYYRTSLTLPAHSRKPRSVLGSRESWFSSVPESSSEDEEDSR